MSTPEIQIAFQGGGAKLAVMLPVAQAFLEAQAKELIKIRAVSGTSAGAICASLVAAKADIDQARKYIKDNGENHSQKLVPMYIKKMRDALTSKSKLDKLIIVLYIRQIWNIIINGAPALNSSELENFLKSLFERSAGKKDFPIEGFDTDLLIIASNIVVSKSVDHRSGSLIAALMDSCSLPVLLRSFANLNQNHHVDGGICDNLPIDGLSNPKYPVFAVFPRTDKNPDNIKNIMSYLLSLFSASINHNVFRSRTKVLDAFCFELETELDTTDFERAIKLLSDDEWYSREKDNALRRIRDFADSYGFISESHEVRVTDIVDLSDYTDSLSKISENQEVEIVKARFSVWINCDNKYNSLDSITDRRGDTVTRTTELRAKKQGASFYKAHLILHNNSVLPCLFKAQNLTKGTQLPIRVLPLFCNINSASRHKQCIIHFLTAKTDIDSGDIIEIFSTYTAASPNDMRKINIMQPDYFGFRNEQPEAIEMGELVFVYPRRLGKMMMATHPSRSSIPLTPVSADKFKKSESNLIGYDKDVIVMSFKNLKNDESVFALISPLGTH